MTMDWSESQLSLVCERATASNEDSSRLWKVDNLRPKLLISKQTIVNLGEEYLPSKFFSMPQTGEDFHNLSQYKDSYSGQNIQ